MLKFSHLRKYVIFQTTGTIMQWLLKPYITLNGCCSESIAFTELCENKLSYFLPLYSYDYPLTTVYFLQRNNKKVYFLPAFTSHIIMCKFIETKMQLHENGKNHQMIIFARCQPPSRYNVAFTATDKALRPACESITGSLALVTPGSCHYQSIARNIPFSFSPIIWPEWVIINQE